MSKLSQEDKKKYQTVSRVVGIIMRIGNIGCWIGVVGLIIGTIALAVIAPNIKVDKDAKEISLFDKTSSYTIKDKDLVIGDGKDEIIIKDNEIRLNGDDGAAVSVKLTDGNIEEIEKFIENDLVKIIAVIPYIMALGAVALVFAALALGHGAHVFKNIGKEETPFTEENVERSEKSVKYLLIILVISCLIDMIMAVVITNGKASGSLTGSSVGSILTLYVAIYVLKSGLEAKTPAKKEDK